MSKIYTLRDVRKQANFTQAQLACEIGTAPRNIFNWENNIKSLPAWQFARICDACKVSMDSVFLPEK